METIETDSEDLLGKYKENLLAKVKSKTLLLGHETTLEELVNKQVELDMEIEGYVVDNESLRNETQRQFKRNILIQDNSDYQDILTQIKDITFAIASTKIDISKNTYLMKYYELSLNAV